MKVGDLVGFNWDKLAVSWIAIVRRVQRDDHTQVGHIEVFWMSGGLKGQIKCYHPNQLKKLNRT